jgi:hypothetical protein
LKNYLSPSLKIQAGKSELGDNYFPCPLPLAFFTLFERKLGKDNFSTNNFYLVLQIF